MPMTLQQANNKKKKYQIDTLTVLQKALGVVLNHNKTEGVWINENNKRLPMNVEIKDEAWFYVIMTVKK